MSQRTELYPKQNFCATPFFAVGSRALTVATGSVMENPTRNSKPLNISATREDNLRLMRVKHMLEVKEQQRLSTSEVIRRAIKKLEQELITAPV